MYKTILLAYDSSIEGAKALREGALLARQYAAKVFLLSVLPRSADVQVAEGTFAGIVVGQTDSYQALLERAVARLTDLGMKPRARLVVGDPAPVIGEVAREIGADLVVVGHRQQNLIARWWFGSTGAYLSDHLSCSLLIARSTISDEAFDAEMRATARSAAD